ncbi:MAG: hypothetical protein ACMUHU_05885, partial [Thermoplasmatota archaeon]
NGRQVRFEFRGILENSARELDIHTPVDLAQQLRLKAVDQDVLSPLVNHKWDMINPGAWGLYTISINNKGNLNDSYEIMLLRPPIEAGWNWYFFETGTLKVEVNLTAQLMADQFGGKSGQTFTVYVECPYEATRDTKIPIILKGVSNRSNETVTRTDELIMIVGERNGLSMFIYEDPIQIFGPNNTVAFHLGITNTGNKDVVNVLLSVEGKISGWDVKFPEEPVPVYKDQTKLVPIRIRAPNWARFQMGEGYMFNFIGVIEGAPNYRVNVTLRVPKISGWQAYIPPIIDPDIDPGGTLNASLRIYSRSNFDDIIHFKRIDTDDQLEVDITDREGLPVDALSMEAFGDAELVVRINASEDAVAGNHTVVFRLTPVENEVIEVSATVNATQYGGLHSTFLDGSLEIRDIAPIREKRRFTIEVKNNGNGPDNVSLSLGRFFYRDPLVKVSLSDGWHANFIGVSPSREPDLENVMVEDPFQQITTEIEEGKYYRLRMMAEARYPFHEIHFIIGRGDTAYVDVEVWGDSGDGSYIVDDIDLEFLVTSVFWPENIFLALEIELLYPDLAFDPLVYSLYDELGGPVEKVRPDQELFLVIKVMNMGEARSDITTIDVFVSGEFWCLKDLGPLEPLESREVVIPLRSGTTSLVIVLRLDPDNTVHEFMDQYTESSLAQNNRMSLGFEVGEEERDRSPLPYIAGAVIGSIVLLLIIMGVLLLLRKFTPRNESVQ